MEFSAVAIRIAFLIFPGLIATQLYRKLRGRRPKEGWESLVEVLIFAISSYLVVFVVSGLLYRPDATGPAATSPNRPASDSLLDLMDEHSALNWPAVFIHIILPATGVSLLLALAASFIHSQKWVNRIGRWLHVSHRSGDGDAWEYFFDSPSVQWILLRDHKTNRAYYGFVRLYSESSAAREVILEKVLVCSNDTGKQLYNLESLYLSREPSDITVELNVTPSTSVPEKSPSEIE